MMFFSKKLCWILIFLYFTFLPFIPFILSFHFTFLLSFLLFPCVNEKVSGFEEWDL